MKPENMPKHGYNFEVFSCPTPERLQKVFDENKDKEGFYPYYIPQSQGVILVVATKNPEAFLDTKPRIELGLQPLKEHEAKQALIHPEDSETIKDVLDTIITLAYEQGYELCKRIEKEAKL